jgi:hypothetical protein
MPDPVLADSERLSGQIGSGRDHQAFDHTAEQAMALT